jgi:hypothetical protein
MFVLLAFRRGFRRVVRSSATGFIAGRARFTAWSFALAHYFTSYN